MSAPSAEGASSTSSFTPADIIKAVTVPRVRLDVYSHGIKVSRFGGEIRALLIDMCRTEWAEYGVMQNRHTGRRESKIKRVFVGTNRARDVFHIHRNQLDLLILRLRRAGISDQRIEIIKHEIYEPVKCEHKRVDTRPPRDVQVPVIEYVLAPPDARYAPSKVVTLQTGKGKMQPLSAAIKVPGGWKTMGEIEVGDYVTGQNGQPTLVEAVFPHSQKQMFRVTFADGRSTECGEEHLWHVFYVNTVKHKRWRTVDTKEMMRLLAMPNPRVYVPLCEPEIGEDIDLPLDPWVLGVLIGDGSLSGSSVCISTPDQFILDKLNERVADGLQITHRGGYDYAIAPKRGEHNPLISALRRLKLMGARSHEKQIPQIYFSASPRQRWELLQGLMDTDGTVNSRQTGGAISYNTTSEFLAEQVQYLVRSLGGIASISPRQTYYTHDNQRRAGRPSFDVNIRMKTPSRIFTLPRKSERTNDAGQYAADLKLRVVSIEPTRISDAKCIQVAAEDHLYVTDDFVVTHNTFLGLYCMRELGSRICIVLPARYMKKWVGDIEDAYGKEKGSILTISGLKDLRNAFQMVKDGEFKARVVLISTTTMFMYFKYIEQFGVDDIVKVHPYDFYKYFGFGVRLIDEVHEEFHCNYRMDCYGHVPLTISLSATLEADQEFTNKMYHIVWPVGTWAPKIEHHRYIEIQSLQYRFKDEHLPKIRYLNFMRQYSHTELEKSIMKHKPILRNYVEMIHDIVDKKYIQVHQPGQRCLVFVATKDMATIVSDHLKSSYRDKLVNRYISEDDYDRLTEADIAVSTLKSAGTAVDIPDLRITLMTTALSTKQGNEQALGRTRPLVSYPDVNPEFLFLTAMNIDKHVTYQREKKEKLYGKALSFNEVRTHFEI